MTSDKERAADLERALLSDLPSLAALAAFFRAKLERRLLPGPLPAGPWDVLMRCLPGAVVAAEDGWHATPTFAALLAETGPDLSARAQFAALAATDILEHGHLLATDPERFFGAARTFGFFRYDRARGTGAAHLEDTAHWVAYVEALSRQEAPALAPLIPLDGISRLLEIGGNTGIMAAALCELHPDLAATVIDLPAVASLGTRAAYHPRVGFLGGDARDLEWPAADAVLFKSVLHDWAEEAAVGILTRAAEHLGPGGRVIICERGAIADEPPPRGAEAAANLVFAPFYRSPELYTTTLTDAGLQMLPTRSVTLDMTFHVTAAERPA